jgi:nucleolar protein 58
VKEKDVEELKDKRKASEMGSDGSEGEEPLVKKVKSRSVIEDSEEEWEGIPDKGDWWKDSGEVAETEEILEGTEGVWASSVGDQEKTEEDKEKEQREARRAKREARRAKREARRAKREARRGKREVRRS